MQHALLPFVEACKKTIDNRGVVGAILKDLSKALDCLSNENCKIEWIFLK